MHSRVSVSVLITIALMITTVGCSSSSTGNHAAGADPAASSGERITASIQAGKNPFQPAGIQEPQALLDVFQQVKVAIASDNKAEVASHLLYPLRVNGEAGKTLIATRGDFVKQYDAFITPSVKKAIANQNPDYFFVNYQGVMVGNGEIWFGGSADAEQVIGIIAINYDISR